MKSFATIVSLAVAALTLLVPTAQATTPRPLSDVQLSREAVTQPADLIERYVQARSSAPAPDLIERYAQAHTSTPMSDLQLSRFGDRTVSTPVLAGTTSSSGFDWADASIGAGAILVALILATAAMLALRGTRERFLRA